LPKQIAEETAACAEQHCFWCAGVVREPAVQSNEISGCTLAILVPAYGLFIAAGNACFTEEYAAICKHQQFPWLHGPCRHGQFSWGVLKVLAGSTKLSTSAQFATASNFNQA